jgi:hypothetical protein
MTCRWHVRVATDQGALRAANRIPPGGKKENKPLISVNFGFLKITLKIVKI